jgi:hypothetical protein
MSKNSSSTVPIGPAPDPEQIADKVFDEFLDGVAEQEPPSAQPATTG